MKPIPGWVIDDCGPELLIKLRTGPTVAVPLRDDLRWGDPAFVLYDYESRKVNRVWSYDELVADEGAVEILWHEFDNPWELPTLEEVVEALTR